MVCNESSKFSIIGDLPRISGKVKDKLFQFHAIHLLHSIQFSNTNEKPTCIIR